MMFCTLPEGHGVLHPALVFSSNYSTQIVSKLSNVIAMACQVFYDDSPSLPCPSLPCPSLQLLSPIPFPSSSPLSLSFPSLFPTVRVWAVWVSPRDVFAQPSAFRDGETTIKFEIYVFEVSGIGGSEENCPKTLCFSFSWETPQ